MSRPDAATTIATYAYDGVNRRQSKVVTNCGIENTAGDGGDTTVHFYYGSATGSGGIGGTGMISGGAGFQPVISGMGGAGILAGGSVPWNIFETRNGSNQTTRQWCWGTQYIDEVLFMDVNGDSTADNDADIDVTVGGESGESPADKRYFYHQDRNWNVVALTEYSPPGSPSNISGRVAERYAYSPYGEFVVLSGDDGHGEMGAVRKSSGLGNILVHQGLGVMAESGYLANRNRDLDVRIARFARRDPAGYANGTNRYAYAGNSPIARRDPSGHESPPPQCPPGWYYDPHRDRCVEVAAPSNSGPASQPNAPESMPGWEVLPPGSTWPTERPQVPEDPEFPTRFEYCNVLFWECMDDQGHVIQAKSKALGASCKAKCELLRTREERLRCWETCYEQEMDRLERAAEEECLMAFEECMGWGLR